MKTTVLTAALFAAFAMPAFAEDVIKTDDAARMTRVDPVTTNSTVQSDMEKAAKDGYSGCIRRKTTAQMM
ncbi:hypothetical protein [Rhizobium sp. LjRoot254]|uniref:hypothetical protein n=1 Tax=Rhizobium sp. LjRoot254 TaxID=3342297 RepID=UPI003ED1599D